MFYLYIYIFILYMSLNLTNVNTNLYVNGQINNGSQGPALFTLVKQNGNPILTPNSIYTTNSEITLVKTEESYYTAFITFTPILLGNCN